MIMDTIRNVFWALAKLLLSASDWMYDTLNVITKLDLSSSKPLQDTWLFFILFLSFACITRVFFVVMYKMSNTTEEDFDLGQLFKKLFYVFLAATLSTTLFFSSMGIPGFVSGIYDKAITTEEKLVSSSAVISATAKTAVTSKLDDMSTTDEIISIETIDEKLNDENSQEDYIYFIGLAELILCGIGAYAVMCVQLNIVVDSISRIMLNILRFVIGFIPISSIVEDKPTFGYWAKDLLSDTITICCNLIFTNLIFGIMTTSAINDLNGIVKLIVFVVSLMVVNKTGAFISRYLGASNLSNGGHVGSMLLGTGAMITMRSASNLAGKIIGGSYSATKQGYNYTKDYYNSHRQQRTKDRINSMKSNKNQHSNFNVGGNSSNSGMNGTPVSHTLQNNPYNSSNINNHSHSRHIGMGGNSVLNITPTDYMKYNSKGASSIVKQSKLGSFMSMLGKSSNYSKQKNPVDKKINNNNFSTQKSNINTKETQRHTMSKEKISQSPRDINKHNGINKTLFVRQQTSGHIYQTNRYAYKRNQRRSLKNTIHNNHILRKEKGK